MPEPASQPASAPTPPAPLEVAAGLSLVQGLLVLLGATAEALAIDSGRVLLGLSTTVFFAIYGAVLVWCAWGLHRVRSWARGPVLMSQLICLGLAWSLRAQPLVSVGLVVVAAIVLAGLLHPRSMEAIEAARD